MIAYLFWHQPASGGPDSAYEDGLQAFHAALAADRPAGLVASASLRVDVPWLAGTGYEDWYLVDDWGDLGTLNDAAVDRAHRGTHDRVAGLAGAGAGAVYALRAGQPYLDSTAAAWLDKPHGAPYERFRADLLAHGAAVWERQLVLGPAPEFCVLGAVAEPLGANIVQREPVWPEV